MSDKIKTIDERERQKNKDREKRTDAGCGESVRAKRVHVRFSPIIM